MPTHLKLALSRAVVAHISAYFGLGALIDGRRVRMQQSRVTELEFGGEIIYLRGPSPFHFVTVPEEQSAAIEAVASMVTYGWGVIPVTARNGSTEFTTSLFPQGELYLVPIKVAVRRAERLELGDHVEIRMRLDA